MNILFLSRYYFPSVGGVEKHVEKVSEKLISKGNNVTVITTKHKNNLKQKEKIKGVNIIRFIQPNIKIVGLIITWIWFMKNISIFEKYDVIHCHDVFVWILPLRLLRPKRKYYVTFHGYPNYPIKKRQVFLQNISEKLTTGNICIGDFIKKWYGTNPNIVSYGAVDISKFKPKKAKSFKYDAIFASRLDEHTGILTYAYTGYQ